MDDNERKQEFRSLCEPNIKIIEQLFQLGLKERIESITDSLIGSKFFTYMCNNKWPIGPFVYAEGDEYFYYDKWLCSNEDEFVIPMILLTINNISKENEQKELSIKKGIIKINKKVISRSDFINMISNVEICDWKMRTLNSFEEFKNEFNNYIEEYV